MTRLSPGLATAVIVAAVILALAVCEWVGVAAQIRGQ